jgi:hypothetical protein
MSDAHANANAAASTTPHSEIDRLKMRRRLLFGLPVVLVLLAMVLVPMWNNRWVMRLNSASEALDLAGDDVDKIKPVIVELDLIAAERAEAGQPFAWLTFLRGAARFRARDFDGAQPLLTQSLAEAEAGQWDSRSPVSRRALERQAKLLLCAVLSETSIVMPPGDERDARFDELLKRVGEVHRLADAADKLPEDQRGPGDEPESIQRERMMLGGIVFMFSERANASLDEPVAATPVLPGETTMGPAPSPESSPD